NRTTSLSRTACSTRYASGRSPSSALSWMPTTIQIRRSMSTCGISMENGKWKMANGGEGDPSICGLPGLLMLAGGAAAKVLLDLVDEVQVLRRQRLAHLVDGVDQLQRVVGAVGGAEAVHFVAELGPEDLAVGRILLDLRVGETAG